jgi:hypothetical protein
VIFDNPGSHKGKSGATTSEPLARGFVSAEILARPQSDRAKQVKAILLGFLCLKKPKAAARAALPYTFDSRTRQ